MIKTQRAVTWLVDNKGWTDDVVTRTYVYSVLRGEAAKSFDDQCTIIDAGKATGYWGK